MKASRPGIPVRVPIEGIDPFVVGTGESPCLPTTAGDGGGAV